MIELHQKFEGSGEGDKDTKLASHALGCVRLSVTTNSALLKTDPLTAAQRKVLALAADERTEQQQQRLFSVFRLADTNFATLNTNIANAYKDWPYPPTTLVLQRRETPRVTHLFKRGDMNRPGEEVSPDTLSILNPLPAAAPRNRLGLARWLVDPASPTTGRVAVNRAWMSFFGQGLVTTPEDFGTRVESPSHPELLDWLACEFMRPAVNDETRMTNDERNPKLESLNDATNAAVHSGLELHSSFVIRHSSLQPWSLKALHRLIVTSATYRQSSKVPKNLYAKDQYNKLLARAPRVRVEGEVVQDIALATSGLLNLKIGGPSVYPAIPGNVGDTVWGGFKWPETKGEDRYRRGLYTFWKRSLPFPSLAAFDAPSGETSCPRRTRSNTPLQALTTLNEKTFVEAAQAMGLRVLKEGGKDERSKMIYAFRLATGRNPTTDETSKLLKFWEEQYDYFENRTADALEVAVPDIKNVPKEINLHRAAAWAMVSRTLLNLDETVTKE